MTIPTNPPITKDDFLRILDSSEDDISNGRVFTWEQVQEETRPKYAL